MKSWDKLLSTLMALSVAFPLWLNLLGLALVPAGYAIGAWAMVENHFFSGVVRFQTERGHAVCDSGPYRFVRHPGYAENIPPLAGIALGLGSLWTLFPHHPDPHRPGRPHAA